MFIFGLSFIVNYFETHSNNLFFRIMSSFCGDEDLILEKQKKREEIKQKALEFYKKIGVPKKIEEILNEILYEKPTDVYGRLVSYCY